VICISIGMLNWNSCSKSELNRKTQTCVSSKMHVCWDIMSGRLKYSYRRFRGYVQWTNKMHTFFINDLIQLYFLRHFSNNQVFILKNSVQAALWNFIMHLYKQISYIHAWQNSIKLLVQSSWGWTLGCWKSVEESIIELSH